jgi:hypothetical protein
MRVDEDTGLLSAKHYQAQWDAALAPVRLSRDGRSVQSGRTSAPMIPHLVHTAFGHKSRTAVSSGRRAASTGGAFLLDPLPLYHASRPTPVSGSLARAAGSAMTVGHHLPNTIP